MNLFLSFDENNVQCLVESLDKRAWNNIRKQNVKPDLRMHPNSLCFRLEMLKIKLQGIYPPILIYITAILFKNYASLCLNKCNKFIWGFESIILNLGWKLATMLQLQLSTCIVAQKLGWCQKKSYKPFLFCSSVFPLCLTMVV